MPIPKVIYQIFKTNQILRLFIKRFGHKNKAYNCEFYDDQRIDDYQGLLKFIYKWSEILIYSDLSLQLKKMQKRIAGG